MEQGQNKLPPAYFHYLFMQPNNVPATFVEEINRRVCPLCNFDGKSNEGLLDHCGMYHGTLLDASGKKSPAIGEDGEEDCAYFEAATGEEGQLHVVVRGVPKHPSHPPTTCIRDNFVFVQPRLCTPRDNAPKSTAPRTTTIPILRRRRHKTASLDRSSRNKKLPSLRANDAPASAISAHLTIDDAAAPIRQYFHARTNLPMSRGSWMEDSDDGGEEGASDDDEAWLHEMSSELLDEFEDVSAKEKQFMKLWNRFIKCNHVIADRDVPGKCHGFILRHREQLCDGGLRLNLLLHLFNLWDSGVISSKRILSCMSLFDGTDNDDLIGLTMPAN